MTTDLKYKTVLEVGKLYLVEQVKEDGEVGPQGEPNLWINSGTVNVYGSGSLTAPVALSGMTLNAENTGVGPGHVLIAMAPTYIALTQASGTSTEIVIYGISVTDLGAIA